MWKITERFAGLGIDYFNYSRPTVLNGTLSLVHLNHQLIKQINLENITEEEWLKLLSGQELPANYQPLASVYMGHQFGIPVPQLGDGRALLIAEHLDSFGQIWEMQLKGAGKTPYSRFADGRAVLRSSIREYLASHAMHTLGVPTTLASGILTSDDPVFREQPEPAAIILRLAPSFLRFGHFEYFAYHNKIDQLEQLVKFCCHHYFPDIDINSTTLIPEFLKQICIKTALLIAKWQGVGFVHGVMNTDNMSILGLTIDYGPYSFMDAFNPEHIYNHSDSEGRYTYAQQPMIAWWNLYRLADALVKLYPYPEKLEQTLSEYSSYYNQYYLEIMTGKLGISKSKKTDLPLIDELLTLLNNNQVDWTWFWRHLSNGSPGRELITAKYPQLNLTNWYLKLDSRYKIENLPVNDRLKLMKENNPAIVPRNHLLQLAIARAEAGDYHEVARLFDALSSPYQEHDKFSDYYNLPPSWAEQISLSCSS